MNKDQIGVIDKTLDLQIFIAGLSKIQGWHAGGIPQFGMQGRATCDSRSIAQSYTQAQSDSAEQIRGEPVYVAICNSQVVETVRFPFTQEEINKILETLSCNPSTPNSYVVFGMRLFEVLFQGGIRDTYRELLSQARREGRKLRITIATTAPEVALLPWELLCDPYPQLLPTFLCQDPTIRLIRALRLFNRFDFKPQFLGKERSLKILLVTSSPLGKPLIDVETDIQILDYVVNKLPDRSKFVIERLREPTAEDLRHTLRRFNPHVLHVAAHAGYEPNVQSGFVYLAPSQHDDSKGRVNSYRFATMMKEAGNLQLVFLNTCLGAYSEDSSALSGIAQCIHAAEIPNVVALMYQIRDSTAHAIVLHFYSQIFGQNGQTVAVEDAVCELRRGMFLDGYMAQESFGLSLFQTNTKLVTQFAEKLAQQETPSVPASVAAGDNDTTFSTFHSWYERFKSEKSSDIIKQAQAEREFLPLLFAHATMDFETLLDQVHPGALSKANEVFEGWAATLTALSLAIPRLSSEQSGKKDSQVSEMVEYFVAVAKLAKRIAQSHIEGKSIQTSIAMLHEADFIQYTQETGLSDKDLEHVDLFPAPNLSSVLRQALKVNGSTNTLVAVVDTKKRSLRAVRMPLRDRQSDSLPSVIFPNAMSQWRRLKQLVGYQGCAFAISGGGRCKFIAGGEQLLEFFQGRWFPADMRLLYQQTVELERALQVSDGLLIDIVEKAIFSASQHAGKGIFLQRKTDLLKTCMANIDISHADSSKMAAKRQCKALTPQEFLEFASGDHSVVISQEGDILGVNLPLISSKDAHVKEMGGSRHLLAQTITKETDAIAVVASDDGPLAVIRDGTPAIIYLREDNTDATK